MIVALLLAWIGARLSAPWWYWVMLGMHLLVHLAKFSIQISRTTHNTIGGE